MTQILKHCGGPGVLVEMNQVGPAGPLDVGEAHVGSVPAFGKLDLADVLHATSFVEPSSDAAVLFYAQGIGAPVAVNISQSHAPIKDTYSPSLGTGRSASDNTAVDKRQAVAGRIKPVLVQRKCTCCLILHQNITSPISGPIGKVDAHTRPRHIQRDLGAVSPLGRRPDVSKDLGGVAVIVDPDVVIGAGTAHVAVKVAISFALGAATARVLPHVHVVPVGLVLEVDKIGPAGPVYAGKLDVVLDVGCRRVAGTSVGDSNRSPVGHDAGAPTAHVDPRLHLSGGTDVHVVASKVPVDIPKENSLVRTALSLVKDEATNASGSAEALPGWLVARTAIARAYHIAIRSRQTVIGASVTVDIGNADISCSESVMVADDAADAFEARWVAASVEGHGHGRVAMDTKEVVCSEWPS